jgi:mono/diheme cytochrome c family protein
MSGHEMIARLVGEGVRLQSCAQCHQPLIGALSPAQANQPW